MCRYDSGGAAAGVTTLTSGGGGGGGKADRRITLAMIKDEGMGAGGATSWVQVCLHCTACCLCRPACQSLDNPMSAVGGGAYGLAVVVHDVGLLEDILCQVPLSMKQLHERLEEDVGLLKLKEPTPQADHGSSLRVCRLRPG